MITSTIECNRSECGPVRGRLVQDDETGAPIAWRLTCGHVTLVLAD